MAFSFRRLAGGVLLFNASGGVLYAVLPLFEVKQGGGPVLATLIVGAPLLAQTLATFLWGTLSDRWGRRREMLVAGVLGQSVLFLAYPFLDPLGLLLVRIVQVFLGAASALATTVATEDPGQAPGPGLGNLSFWGNVGGALGLLAAFPFLGGTQFRSSSPASLAMFALLGLLSAGSVLLLAASGEILRRSGPAAGRGLLTFRSGPWVLRLSAGTVLIGAANYTIYTLFPLFIYRVMAPMGLFGWSLNPTEQLAVLSLGAGMGGVVVSPWTGQVVERPGVRRRLFLLAPVLYAALWSGFALLRSYPAIFAIWSVPAFVLFMLPLNREVAELTPPEERGRAVGLLTAAFSFGGLLGAGLAGWGSGAGFSFATMFLTGAALDLVGFVVLLVVVVAGEGMPLQPGSSPWKMGRESP